MNTLDELFQQTLDTPQYQLIEMARANLVKVLEFLQDYTGNIQAASALMSAIGTFVAADGVVSAGEYEFMRSVLRTDLDYDTFFSAAEKGTSADLIESIDKAFDVAPTEVKFAFVALCLDFIACDGEITPEEKRLLVKYLS